MLILPYWPSVSPQHPFTRQNTSRLLTFCFLTEKKMDPLNFLPPRLPPKVFFKCMCTSVWPLLLFWIITGRFSYNTVSVIIEFEITVWLFTRLYHFNSNRSVPITIPVGFPRSCFCNTSRRRGGLQQSGRRNSFTWVIPGVKSIKHFVIKPLRQRSKVYTPTQQQPVRIYSTAQLPRTTLGLSAFPRRPMEAIKRKGEVEEGGTTSSATP